MSTDAGTATRLRKWAQAYRDTPECRFPSDPHAEFFPQDLEYAADELDRAALAAAQAAGVAAHRGSCASEDKPAAETQWSRESKRIWDEAKADVLAVIEEWLRDSKVSFAIDVKEEQVAMEGLASEISECIPSPDARNVAPAGAPSEVEQAKRRIEEKINDEWAHKNETPLSRGRAGHRSTD